MSKITREQYQIRSLEIDRYGRATLSALIQAMQEVAWNNSAELGASVYDLHKKGVSWVLTRMKLEIENDFFLHFGAETATEVERLASMHLWIIGS